jgi:hypothetical protein
MKAAVKNNRKFLLCNSYKHPMKAHDVTFTVFTTFSSFFSAFASAPPAAFVLSTYDIAIVVYDKISCEQSAFPIKMTLDGLRIPIFPEKEKFFG